MPRNFYSSLPQSSRKRSRLILAFCWFSGLCCGMAVYDAADASVLPLMRSFLWEEVSIVTLLWVNLLPFLFSAIAVFLSAPALVLPVCFCRAVLLGFVSLGILQSFGAAGWFLLWLLMFSRCACVPVLYLYWLCCLERARPSASLTALFGAVCTALCCVEYCIISPFAACLIDFQKG